MVNFKQQKFIWITDPHFNFLTKNTLVKKLVELQSSKADGIFITGDITTGNQIYHHLDLMVKIITKPIYFVLGNHDFYHECFEAIDILMKEICLKHSNLYFLDNLESIKLNENTGLIGHTGWYDGRWRNPKTSIVYSWDFALISDFKEEKHFKSKLRLVRDLADMAAEQIGRNLEKALQKYDTVYMLTHIPPWPERYSSLRIPFDLFWKPYNSSKIMADTLSYIMDKHPGKQLNVLAGHTHNRKYTKISNNINLFVGDATHGKMHIENIFSI